MGKYYFYLKNQISLITTYRFDLAWRWVSNIFEIVVYFSLWSLTASGDLSALKKLLIYYVLFYGILHTIQSSRVAAWMGEDISSGNLNQYLTKPVNFPLMTIIRTSTMLISRVTVPLLMLIVGSIFFPSYLAPASVGSLLMFIIFACLGFVMWNLLMILVGCLAFWLTEISALKTVLDLFFSFVKGSYIPYYLYPESFRVFLEFTPFRYLTSFPIDIYQGLVDLDHLIKGLIVCVLWIMVMAVMGDFIYKRGVKRYEAYG